MSEHDKSDQARKGLIDSVKGKAKEVAGAVTGNDSLTAEGQLEQAQAQERKEANSVEAVADAEAEQARHEATEARLDAATEVNEVNAKAAVTESAVVAQQAAARGAAEQAGQHQAAQDRSQAELDAQREVERARSQERVDLRAADGEAVDAIDDHQLATDEADDALAEADRLRERADTLTEHADLP